MTEDTSRTENEADPKVGRKLSTDDLLERGKELADAGDRWFLSVARSLGAVARSTQDGMAAGVDAVVGSAQVAAQATRRMTGDIVDKVLPKKAEPLTLDELQGEFTALSQQLSTVLEEHASALYRSLADSEFFWQLLDSFPPLRKKLNRAEAKAKAAAEAEARAEAVRQQEAEAELAEAAEAAEVVIEDVGPATEAPEVEAASQVEEDATVQARAPIATEADTDDDADDDAADTDDDEALEDDDEALEDDDADEPSSGDSSGDQGRPGKKRKRGSKRR